MPARGPIADGGAAGGVKAGKDIGGRAPKFIVAFSGVDGERAADASAKFRSGLTSRDVDRFNGFQAHAGFKSAG